MQNNYSQEYGVVILGAGIAGTVLTYLLNRNKINTLLIGKTENPRIKLGESIPPSILPMLERLGLSQFFSRHRTSSGYQSVWGSRQINQTDFEDTSLLLGTLQSTGWKIDKTTLIEQIRQTLPDNTVLPTNVKTIEVSESGHIIHLRDERQPIRAKFVVISTGRHSQLNRQLGISSHQFDQLLAYTVNVPRIDQEKITKPIFIEAFEHGWGLVSKLNDSQNVLSLFTNKYSEITTKCNKLQNWHSLCQYTELFKYFIPDNPDFQMHCFNASSRIANKLHGQNWLLIGDSAMSFDPLSSHGMTTAIFTAEQAANAICQQFTAPGEHLKHYAQKMTSIYNTYLNELVLLYRRESRWPSSGFWQSKQNITQTTEPTIVNPTFRTDFYE